MYHHRNLLLFRGKPEETPLLINQLEKDIYAATLVAPRNRNYGHKYVEIPKAWCLRGCSITGEWDYLFTDVLKMCKNQINSRDIELQYPPVMKHGNGKPSVNGHLYMGKSSN
jgi:hypothetical protein